MKIDTNSPSEPKIYKPLCGGEHLTPDHVAILSQPVVWGQHWATGEIQAIIPGYRNLPKNTRQRVRKILSALTSEIEVRRFNMKREVKS